MKYAMTFEHDIKPSVTIRGESTYTDIDRIMRQALRVAEKAHPHYPWSSLVLVIEKPRK